MQRRWRVRLSMWGFCQTNPMEQQNKGEEHICKEWFRVKDTAFKLGKLGKQGNKDMG